MGEGAPKKKKFYELKSAPKHKNSHVIGVETPSPVETSIDGNFVYNFVKYFLNSDRTIHPPPRFHTCYEYKTTMGRIVLTPYKRYAYIKKAFFLR